MIVRRLKDTREDNDLTQKDIARVLNVDSKTISGWETGKDTIPLKRLIQYGNTYGYSLDYLFGLSKKNNYSKSIEINLNNIGNNLKNIRIKNNLTQEEVASFLNTSHTLISYYESGVRLINTTFLYALAQKYKFSIDEVFR